MKKVIRLNIRSMCTNNSRLVFFFACLISATVSCNYQQSHNCNVSVADKFHLVRLDDALPAEGGRRYSGEAGYVLYYFNPETDCQACLSALFQFSEYGLSYSEIAFLSVLRTDDSDSEYSGAEFSDYMDRLEIKSQRLWDKHGEIKQFYGLGSRPYVLILDKELRVTGIFQPKTLMAIENPTFFHRILQEI